MFHFVVANLFKAIRGRLVAYGSSLFRKSRYISVKATRQELCQMHSG